jgi:hypothetical protein
MGLYGFKSSFVATQNMARQYKLSETERLYTMLT